MKLALIFVVFLVGLVFGEYKTCKKMGKKYDIEYGVCK